MEAALNSTEPKRKIKTILLCLKTKVVISKFIEALEAQGITDLIEYKIITPEEFDSKPFGDDSEVEILGVNWGMP